VARNGSAAKGNGTRINWPAARAYWLALPPETRSYKAVADRFGVSDVRVGQIARREGWAKTLEQIEEEAEVAELKAIRRSFLTRARARGERIARTLELYDRATDLGLELLPLGDDGEIDLEQITELPTLEAMLKRLPGLHRMAELAAGEATDRVSIAEVQPILVALGRVALRRASSAEERAQIIGELEQATSGLLTIDAGRDVAAVG
jgi:hypothetical protein